MHNRRNFNILIFYFRFGGLVLDYAEKFKGFVIFQPIVNGIGGNLVSVQASRISTMFHQTSILGIIPPHTKTWVSPIKALFTGGELLSWNILHPLKLLY